MANNLVVQLLLKTGAFSSDLKKQKSQIQSFNKECEIAGKSVTSFGKGLGINIGSLAKFGSAAGAAALVADTLAKSLKTNADIADKFDKVMEQSKAHMQSFFHAIGSGNFKEFVTNWKQVSESAGLYAELVDEAGSRNATLNAVLQVTHTKYEELVSKARDVGNTDKQRLEYLAAANQLLLEEVKIREGLAKNERRLLFANLQKSINANGADFSFDQVGDVLQLNKLLELSESGVWGFELEENLTSGFMKQLARALKDMENNPETRTLMTDYWKNIINNLDQTQIDAFKAEQEKILNQAGARINGRGSKNSKETANVMRDSLKYWDDLISKYEKEQNTVEVNSKRYRELALEIKFLKEEYQKLLDSIAPLEKIDAAKLLPQTQNYGLGPLKQTGLAMTQKTVVSKFDLKGSIEQSKNFANSIMDSAQAVTMLSESLKNLTKTEDENVSVWQNFVNVLSLTINLLNGMTTLMNTINTLTEVYGTVSLTAAGKAVAGAAAETAAAGAETAANTAAAASGAAASQAAIPVVGPVLAVAAIAAIMAAINSATKNAGRYANGGIVPGSSFTGDRLTANVNSGEMILNRNQQANLFRQINNGGMGGDVTFHISGSDLVGTLNNYNKKNRLVR